MLDEARSKLRTLPALSIDSPKIKDAYANWRRDTHDSAEGSYDKAKRARSRRVRQAMQKRSTN